MTSILSRSVSAALVAILLGGATSALAQSDGRSRPACQDQAAPSFGRLVTGTVGDFRRLPSRETAMWLTAGGVAALGAHSADSHTTRTLSGSQPLHEALESGAVVGSTPVQLGAAFHDIRHRPCAEPAVRRARRRRSRAGPVDGRGPDAGGEGCGQTNQTGGCGLLVSVGPRDDHVRIGNRSPAALRLESRRAGLCGRLVRGGIARPDEASLLQRRGIRRGARDCRRAHRDARKWASARRANRDNRRRRRIVDVARLLLMTLLNVKFQAEATRCWARLPETRSARFMSTPHEVDRLRAVCRWLPVYRRHGPGCGGRRLSLERW